MRSEKSVENESVDEENSSDNDELIDFCSNEDLLRRNTTYKNNDRAMI